MTDEPLKKRKRRRASKRLGVKAKKRVSLKKLSAEAIRERENKYARKYAAKRAKRIKDTGGTKLTVYVSGTSRQQLTDLCRATKLTQMQVIAALLDIADPRAIVAANPTSPIVDSRLEEIRRRIAAIKERKP